MSVEGFNYEDNLLLRMLNRLGDIMILSVIFAVSCAPIFTIGAAFSAAYYTSMKALVREDGYVFKNYIKSFKQNFKQATVMWLMFIVVFFVLGVDVWFWVKQIQQVGSIISKGMFVISVVMLAMAFFTFLYTFAIQAKFDNKKSVQIRNGFLLAIKYFPTTIIMTLIFALVVFLFYYQPALSFVGFIMIGFGIVWYVYGAMMSKCLKPYLPEEIRVSDYEDWSVDTAEVDVDAEVDEVKENAIEMEEVAETNVVETDEEAAEATDNEDDEPTAKK